MSQEIILLRASLQGDTAAFEQIVLRYQAMVCAITYSATGRVDTSEELAQETFLRAWQKLIQLQDPNKFRSWLCSIARNLIRDYLLHKSRQPIQSADLTQLPADKTIPSDHLIKQEEEMMLNQALMQIPEEYREPLVLYYRQEQSVKEVAESLDIPEATVRTRMHRGRQMLKDQVATMVERTLEKTGPSKKFTKAVMVSIGAGLAAGTAATAGMAAAGAGVSTAATGILTATVAKAAAIVAAVILSAGVAIYSYNNSQEKIPTPQPIQQKSLLAVAPQTETPTPIAVKQDNPKPEPVPQPQPEKLVVIEKKPDPQPQTPKVRHPDWPGIDEPIKYVYGQTQYVYTDNIGRTDKLWARLPDAFRNETAEDKIIIDNGKQRLILDPNTRQAQIEPTWYRDGKMIWRQQQSLEEHPVMDIVKAARDPNSNSDCILLKLSSDNKKDTTLYQVKLNNINDPNSIQFILRVDNRTCLPEKMNVIVVGDPNQFGNILRGSVTFDFSPIPDTAFSIDVPAGYKAKTDKLFYGFGGTVVDLLGQSVAGAEVFVHFDGLDKRGPLKGTTDQNGQFNILLQGEQVAHSSIALWAKLPDNPDFIGWTFLLGPYDRDRFEDEQKRGYPLGGTIPGSPGIIYPSEDYLDEKTGKSTTYGGSWCVTASDIILVMEPASKVLGWVQDTQGNAVPNAKVNVSVGSFSNQGGYLSEAYIGRKHHTDLFTTQTNQQGYYEIGSIPKLWKKCHLSIGVNPDKSSNLTSDSRGIEITDPNQPIQADFVLLPQGPTVRGIVVDNYGTPLPERYINIRVNGKSFPGKLTKTDKKGRFEFKYCPADMGLQVNAELSHNSMAPHEPEKYMSYVYYPDVTVNVGYQPGQEEYEVKLVAVKPEIEIEATLIDSAGNPLPYCVVEIRADKPISTQWLIDRKLEGRTDENGVIKFVNAPEMKGLRLVCSYWLSNNIFDSEQSPEMQEYFKQLEKDNKHHWTEAMVPLEPGQKKYQMTIIIPTEEEYKQQKELEKSSQNQ
jgi:RNA polymerase sigma factor (sigma-70 family)